MSTMRDAFINQDRFLVIATVQAFKGSAEYVAWVNVTGKPSIFPPETHNHASDAWLLSIINPLNNHVADANLHVSVDILAKIAGIADNANNYQHPVSHPASIITQDLNNRFVSDAQILSWDNKAEISDISAAVANIVGAAPASLDTLYEIAAAFQNNPDVISEILTSIGLRATQVDFLAHTGDGSLHINQTLLNKINGIEDGATGDQTAVELEALFDAYYRNTDWRLGGGPSLDEDLTINKATDTTWPTVLTTADGAGNAQGNNIIASLANGTHDLGSATVQLLKPYNGKLRIEAANAIGARGTNQNAIINLNAANGKLEFLSDINLEFNFLAFVASANANQIPLNLTNKSNAYLYRCFIDFDLIPGELSLGDGGNEVVFNQCVFRGSAPEIANIWNNANVKFYDCIILDRAFTNGVKGFGTILPGNSSACFTNAVEASSPAIELNQATPSTPADLPTITPGTTSATDTTLSIPLTANRVGTIYGRLYLASATPTASEVAAGTGAIETQSVVTTGDVEETLTFNDAAIAASTSYRVFYWLEGFAPTVEVKNLTQATTAPALTQLTAPVLSAGTPTDTTIPFTFTDPNTSPNEESFEVEYEETASPGYVSGVTPAQDATSETQTGLTAETEYHLRIRAKGNGTTTSDSDWSNVITVSTTASSSNMLSNGSLDDATGWIEKGTGVIGGGVLTITANEAGGIGQTTANMNTPLTPSSTIRVTFDLTYVSGVGIPLIFIGSEDLATEYLAYSDYTEGLQQYVDIVLPSDLGNGGFSIYASGARGRTFTLDNINVETL